MMNSRRRPFALLLLLVAALATAPPALARKRIALTFDDVPRQPGAFMTPAERTLALIAALRRANVRQAAFFVTTRNLELPHGEGGAERIAAYVRAGHVIGNHSHGHFWLHRTPAETYIADLDRAAAWLRGRRGYRPWFRFPFLDEGRTDIARRDALRAALRERRLRNAYVTIDSYDWLLEDLTRRAMTQGLLIDRAALRALYVESIVGAANFAEGIAVRTLGRSPAHVILLHETDIAALFIADAVAALRADGWEIVTADRAYRDPIARIEPDTYFLSAGRVAAIGHTRGQEPRSLVSPWTDEAHLTGLFRARALGQREPR